MHGADEVAQRILDVDIPHMELTAAAHQVGGGRHGIAFGHWFTYGLYGIICIVAAIFVWKLVPETKGKTLEDMTKLWKNR